MSRYWVFHEQRLKGPLEPEGLRALAGFTLDMRVCPEGGPETDWRPAREHDAIAAAFGRPEAAGSAPAADALPSIPRLAPIAPAAAPAPVAAADQPRVSDLERRVADLESQVAALKARLEERASAPEPAERKLDEPAAPAPLEPAPLEPTPPPPFSPLEHAADGLPPLPTLAALEPPPLASLETPALAPLEPPPFAALEPAPFAALEPAPVPAAEPPAAEPAAPAPRKLRVLAADDDELMRQAVASAFTKEGYEIEVVEDGKTALERIASNPYDIVILDEGMPGGSGFQVARAVSKLDADARPKVLLFTAQYVGNKLARETFLASGADDVLSKEAGLTGLLEKVRQLTGS